MPYLWLPSVTIGPLSILKQTVYVNGALWRFVEFLDYHNYSGIVPGRARLSFPFEYYGSDPVQEQDHIRVHIMQGWDPAPLFRGYVVSVGQVEDGRVIVECFDERGHLNDNVFDKNYNTPDAITGTNPANVDTYEIFDDGYKAYRQHQTSNLNTQYLRIALRDFPNLYAGEQNLNGVAHGVGIQQIIEDVGGGKWRLAIRHYNSFSRLEPFEVGSSGQPRLRTVRGTYPTLPAYAQPDGWANVNKIRRRKDASGVINHLRVYGRERRVETLQALTAGWDTTIQAAVLANYDKYATERILDAENPNYIEGAKDVGRNWKIPEVDDSWTDAAGTPQGRTRHPRIFPDVVQTNPQDSEQKQPAFIIFKYADDSDWRYRDKGFSIKDSSEVQITDTKDFIRQLPYVVASGVSGEGLNVSAPKYQDLANNFSAAGINPAADDYWLSFGATMVTSQVAAAVGTLLTVAEIDGGGNDLTDAPDNYSVFKNFNPNVLTGTGGAKQTATTYLSGISSMTVDEYVGMNLVLGNSFASGVTHYTVFSIVGNTASTFTVERTIENDSAIWKVASDQTSTLELPTDVRLDYAYESERTLFYDTGRLGDSNQDRVIKLARNEFRWETQDNNAALTYLAGAYSVTLPATETDTIKDDTEMQTWAVDRLAATKDVLKTYSVELPFTLLSAQVGMQFYDNRQSTDTNVSAVSHTQMNRGGKTTLTVTSE